MTDRRPGNLKDGKVESNMPPKFFRRWRHKNAIVRYCHTSFHSATLRMAKGRVMVLYYKWPTFTVKNRLKINPSKILPNDT